MKTKKKTSDVTVVDNWLSTADFLILKDLFHSPDTSWFRVPGISDDNSTMDILNPLDNYMFAHLVYDNMVPMSDAFQRIKNIVEPALQKQLGHDFRSIIRIKCNLYPRTSEVQVHPFHTDSNSIRDFRGCLLSLNTCDGYTGFADGTEVDSVENRAIFFDATERHHSTSCSNSSFRLNMNINYV
tara:strand:- start:83 stop:634 length:552 start_codon:yes stop_codon:yes gene_type:complete